MTFRRWTERVLRWAVGDAEASEGLLGDLAEEWSTRHGAEPGGPAYHGAVLALTLRYFLARFLGRPRGAGLSGGIGVRAGDGPGRSLGLALRSLTRAPAFSLAVGTTLALGLGAAGASFAVLQSVVLRPLPFPEADRLVRLQSAVPGQGPDTRWNLAKAQYLFLRGNARTLESAGLYVMNVATVSAPVGPGPSAERARTAQVDPGVFRTLGTRPRYGRAFTEEESLVPAAPVVILAHGYWSRAFGADPGVLGRSMLVDGRSREIVGILPADARLPEEVERPGYPVDLWLPLYVSPAEPPVNSHYLRSVARMATGTDVEGVNRELEALTARLPELFPDAYSPQFMEDFGFLTVATGLQEDVVGSMRATLWIVFGAVVLVLVVACFNAANLVLVRTDRRGRELAVRAALGAGRGRLAGQLLTECLVLSLSGGLAGALVALWSVRVFVSVAPAGVPRLDGVTFGSAGALFVLSASLAVGGLLGLLAGARAGDTRFLGEAGRGQTATRRQHSVRRALVVGQLSVSVMLLAGAALLVRSVLNLTAVDTGVDVDRVLTFRVILPQESYDTPEKAGAFYRQATQRLESLPGVTAVGTASALPVTGFDGCAATFFQDRPLGPDETAPCLMVLNVGPGYFRAMGMEVRGRDIAWSDVEDRAPVTIVSESFARRYWPGEEALGRSVSAYGIPFTPIRAVVGDVRGAGLRSPVWDALYLSFQPPAGTGAWAVARFLHFVVRTDGVDPVSLAGSTRSALADIDPRVPVVDLRPMKEIVTASMARDSFVTLLLAVASALSLLLSALGVYAVISYVVQGRRREMGVRLALGAGRAQVRSLVVRQSVRMALLGVLAGLALALPSGRVLESLLFGVGPADPLVLGSTAAALVLVATAASLAPAARATRVDPIETLRDG